MLKPTADDLVRDPIGRFPAATVACFDPTRGALPRRELDQAATIRFLERLAGIGVPAVLIAASTGHGHLRTVTELSDWMQAASKAQCGATVKQILLRPEDGDEANRRLIELAARLDYQVVWVRPGRNLSPAVSDEEVAENMRPIVRAVAEHGLAAGVYSIPDVSGLPLTPAAAAMLVNGPGGERIVAVKVTEADYDASTLRFLKEPQLLRLKIVQGWDPHLALALRDGPRHDSQQRQRCGVTSGPMSLAAYQYLHLLESAERGDWEEVRAAQAAVTSVFQAMQDDPRKFADLQRAKYIMGLGHPLTGEITQPQVTRVFAALDALPRRDDRVRLAKSLDLMGQGPFHERLAALAARE